MKYLKHFNSFFFSFIAISYGLSSEIGFSKESAVRPPLTQPDSTTPSLFSETEIKTPLPHSPPIKVREECKYYDPLPDLVERVSPGVVNISSNTITNFKVYGMDEFLRFWELPQERKQTSLGSGFIIDQEGFILTNHHVVAHASEVVVTLLDKRQYRAKIIGKDDKMDLALLQIQKDSKQFLEQKSFNPPLIPVSLGNSEQVRVGEKVFAIGNPFGLQNTVTEGIISAKNRTIGLGPFDDFLQTSASINPGNSGGPLFNINGEVIGINTVIYSKIGVNIGLGFAIPSHEAKALIPDLKKFGRISRPWLGLFGEIISPVQAEYYELPTHKGVLVSRIVHEGPAHQANLRRGDILVAIEGKPILEHYDVERALSKHKPQENIKISFYRGNIVREVVLKLKELPPLENIPRGVL